MTPTPPCTCSAFEVTRTPISVANHFAIEVCVSQRTPVASRFSARWHSSRAASISVAISAT